MYVSPLVLHASSFSTPGTPTEEHTRDHSAAMLLSGRRPLVPIGLPVLVGDRLFMDWTAVPCSVTREQLTSHIPSSRSVYPHTLLSTVTV